MKYLRKGIALAVALALSVPSQPLFVMPPAYAAEAEDSAEPAAQEREEASMDASEEDGKEEKREDAEAGEADAAEAEKQEEKAEEKTEEEDGAGEIRSEGEDAGKEQEASDAGEAQADSLQEEAESSDQADADGEAGQDHSPERPEEEDREKEEGIEAEGADPAEKAETAEESGNAADAEKEEDAAIAQAGEAPDAASEGQETGTEDGEAREQQAESPAGDEDTKPDGQTEDAEAAGGEASASTAEAGDDAGKDARDPDAEDADPGEARSAEAATQDTGDAAAQQEDEGGERAEDAESPAADPASGSKALPAEEALFSFNTGVKGADYLENADGSYTILVSENNPTFPYEVQISQNGEAESIWFETPEEEISFGGYVFHISVPEEGYTRLSIEIMGKVKYLDPAPKEFTADTEVGVRKKAGDAQADVSAESEKAESEKEESAGIRRVFQRLGSQVYAAERIEIESIDEGVTENQHVPEVSHQQVPEVELDPISLYEYSPAELTQVSFSSLVPEGFELKDVTIVWTKENDQKQRVTVTADPATQKLDLAYGLGGTARWIFKVGPKGKNTQLSTKDVTNYIIPVNTSSASHWLDVSMYKEVNGAWSAINVYNSYYYDTSYKEDRRLRPSISYLYTKPGTDCRWVIRLSEDWIEDVRSRLESENGNYAAETDEEEEDPVYNPRILEGTVKFFAGKHETVASAEAAEEISSQIWQADGSTAPRGYAVSIPKNDEDDPFVTMVTYDASGKASGCLPIALALSSASADFQPVVSTGGYSLGLNQNGWYSAGDEDDGSRIRKYTGKLYTAYSLNSTYTLTMDLYSYSSLAYSGLAVSSAYEGNYASKAAAVAAGAQDIHEALFGAGYSTSVGSGKFFTIVLEADPEEEDTILYPETYVVYLSLSAGDEDGTYVDIENAIPYQLAVENNYGYSYTYTKSSGNFQKLQMLSEDEDPWTRYVSYDSYSFYSYEVGQEYAVELNYRRHGVVRNGAVTAAYRGRYASISEAAAANAVDIKDALFRGDEEAMDIAQNGYKADYSAGIDFTVFVGEDGEGQEIYRFNLKMEKRESSLTGLRVYDLLDKDGKVIDSYRVDPVYEDSYGDENFYVFLVDKGVDLHSIMPGYRASDNVKLLVDGEDQDNGTYERYWYGTDSRYVGYDQETGEFIYEDYLYKSLDGTYTKGKPQDFSGGAVMYTASSEDKKYSMNYWICVVQADESDPLFINSNGVEESSVQNGIRHYRRELMLDSTDAHHDILLINRSMRRDIQNIGVELVSEQLELDEYWTLDGSENLPSFTSIKENEETSHASLSNLAKVRLHLKEGAEDAKEISGTLRIKSGDTVMAVLDLTGTIGPPEIITEAIPDAVMYVSYGTMIHNNNKYRRNNPTYELVLSDKEGEGPLPEGLELKENGELYGMPKETGDFAFTVEMRNTYPLNTESDDGWSYYTSKKKFTLTVREPSKDNVDDYSRKNEFEDYEDYWILEEESELQEFVDINDLYEGWFSYVAKGPLEELASDGTGYNIFLDGEKLVEGVDYTVESGSTKLTGKDQINKKINLGQHVTGMEFRTKTNEFKRAFKHIEVVDRPVERKNINKSDDNANNSASTTNSSTSARTVRRGGSSGGSGSSSGGGGSSGSSAASLAPVTPGPVRGITYRPDTPGSWSQQADENEPGGIAWYFLREDGSPWTGWIISGHCWYCLDENGKMLTGWQHMGDKWYYFNAVPDATMGQLFVNWNDINGKWYYFHIGDDDHMGEMYVNSPTPDGRRVGEDGARVD